MTEINVAYREMMNAVAESLDDVFNGRARGKDRKVGFTLLVYPFGATDQARCNYIANGANRKDIAVLFREMAAPPCHRARAGGTHSVRYSHPGRVAGPRVYRFRSALAEQEPEHG